MNNLLIVTILLVIILSSSLFSNVYSLGPKINFTVSITNPVEKIKVRNLIPSNLKNGYHEIPLHKIHPLHAVTQSPQQSLTQNPTSPPTKTMTQAPTALSSGFDGIDSTAALFFPPDVQIAAGPSHIAEMVNGMLKIFSKQGATIQTKTLINFFSVSNSTDNVGDVKIMYDALSSRWFASAEDFTTNSIYLAVSTSNDPTSSWAVYNFNVFSSGIDQPILGINDDKVILSVNEDFNSSQTCTYLPLANTVLSTQCTQFLVINKSNLVNGVAATSQLSSLYYPPSLHPVQSLSTTSTLYMVATDTAFPTRNIHLYSITGAVPSASISVKTFQISSNPIDPPTAVQPSTTARLDTGDTRVLDAAWYQGKLWFAFVDSCTPSGDSQSRSCIHLIKLDTATPSLLQSFDYGAVNTYYYYPALRMDSSNNIDVIFGFSSSSAYPSLAITGQSTGDVTNTLESPLTIKSGSQIFTQTDILGRVRYGDYFGAAIDPSNATTIWVAGEYGSSAFSSTNWATFITTMKIPTTCVPPMSGDWTIASSCILANSATVPANVIVQSGSILTIPNGLRLNIDFTHYHLLVKSGGGVLIKAGGAIN